MQYLQFYTKISTNPQLLANGHTLITNYLMQSPENRSITLTNILTPSPPILVLVGNVYPRYVYPQLHQEERIQTRVFILEMLFNNIKQNGVKGKNVQGLLSMIRKMHNQEGYDKWLVLYVKMIQNIPIEYFAQFIIAILQQADNRISTLSINIFSYIMQSIKTHEDISKYPICTENLLQIFYHSIKSFAHLRGTDDQKLQQFFIPYKNWLMSYIWSNIQKNPICMKYCLKLLMILYSDMDYTQEQSQDNIIKLQLFGLQLLNEYINIGVHGGCEVYIKQQDQIQDDEEYDLKQVNSPQTLKKNIPLILYQLLQLYDFLLQQSEVEINTDRILLLCILLVTPSKNSILHWVKNTVDYLIILQDEFQKSIRNRTNNIINFLIEQHPKSQTHRQIISQYFQVVAQALKQGSKLTLLENFVKKRLGIQVKISHGQYLAFQQASYFILASVLQELYKQKKKRKQLIKYLINRVKTIDSMSNSPVNMLIKITITFILSHQLTQPYDENIVDFMKFMVNQDRNVYQNIGIQGKQKQANGLALAVARGIGRVAYNQKILIYNDTPGDIPIQFIEMLISILRTSYRPGQDDTHIILQLLLKLSQISPLNKKLLMRTGFIDPDLQIYMLQNFMHDGLLSVIIKKILIQCPYDIVIKYLTQLLLSGGVVIEQFSEIIVGWLKDGCLNFGIQHIQVLLQKYTNNRRSIISPIIKLYLETLIQNNTQTTPQIKLLLSQNPDQTWLVPMIKSGSLINAPQALLSCIFMITYQYTSKGQIQNKMVLPFYLGINNTSDFLQIIKNSHNSSSKQVIDKSNQLYKDFIQKIHRYSQVFQGKVLRLITTVFWIRISQAELSINVNLGRYLMEKTLKVVEQFGKVPEINQWQDEEDLAELKFGTQESLDKFQKYQIYNQQLQTQLEEVFKQSIYEWNQQFINGKIAMFRKFLEGQKMN